MKRITIQKKGFLYRMDIEKDNLAINEKYNLTIKEAVKYLNIGEEKSPEVGVGQSKCRLHTYGRK